MKAKGTAGDSLPRRPASSEDEQTWMDKENGACNFRDERLKKRFHLLLKQFWTSVGQSIPFACQDWASTKAAYRFFSNDNVSEQGIFRRPANGLLCRTGQYLSFKIRRRFHISENNQNASALSEKAAPAKSMDVTNR